MRLLFVLMLLATFNMQPDPDDIFADGIQWMPYVQPQAQIAHYPVDSSDFPGRSIIHTYLLDDGNVLIQFSSVDRSNNRRVENYVLLNTETGTYEIPATVCNGQIVHHIPHREAEWVIVYEDGQPILCYAQTGEMRDILPPDYIGWYEFASPDGRYVLLAGLKIEYDIYAYDVENDTLALLGSVSRNLDNTPEVCQWFNNEQGVLCLSDYYGRGYVAASYYTFDVSEAHLLEFAFYRFGESVIFLNDLSRYIALLSEAYSVNFTGSIPREHQPCQIVTVDVNGTTRQDVGYECVTLNLRDYPDISGYAISPYLRVENQLYFLTIDSPDTAIAALKVFDMETGETETLLEAEIETLLSISPDGHYGVLVLDDNGIRDGCCIEDGLNRISILRLDDGGTVVYQSEPIGIHTADQIAWLDNETIIIGTKTDFRQVYVDDDDYYNEPVPSALYQITFDADQVSDIQITYELPNLLNLEADDRIFSPNRQYLLIGGDAVIDLETLTYIDVLREGVAETYSIHFSWLENSHLRVHVDDASYEVTLP